VLAIYKVTDSFPNGEKFSLVDQMRRAVVSVTSNMAEGFSRFSKKEKRQFYRMALGSLTELQNQLLIARDLEYLTRDTFNQLAEQSVLSAKFELLIKEDNIL